MGAIGGIMKNKIKTFLPFISRPFAPSSGVSYEQINAFNPRNATAQADTLPEWTILTSSTAGIQQATNRWYAAKTTGYAGVRWSTLPVALATNDNWMTMEVDGLWNGAGDFFGPALRMADDNTSFYAFVIAAAGAYEIRRAYQGIWAPQVSGTTTALVDGDIVKITTVGDVIKGYVNDVLIDTYTDVETNKNTTGDPGVIADGLDADNGYVKFRCGDMGTTGTPVAVFGTWAANETDERYLTDSCFTADPQDTADGSLSSAAGHADATVPHWFEIDFGELRVPDKIRSHGTIADTMDWTNVDVLTKVESGDDWTEVATALDLDNDGVDGWKTSGAFTIVQPCRYVRVEINATLNASNHILTEEVEFECVAIP